MQFWSITGASVLAAVAYGVIHDQVTVRICVEYFTVAHADLFGTTDPTLLALGWGVVGTWWVGLSLGLLLAAAASFGERRTLTVRELVSPIGVLLASMLALAAAAGTVGALLAHRGPVALLEPLETVLPRSVHVRFMAVLWAHSASYLGGAVGGLLLIVWAWRRRGPAKSAR